jgi:hypothetical protein
MVEQCFVAGNLICCECELILESHFEDEKSTFEYEAILNQTHDWRKSKDLFKFHELSNIPPKPKVPPKVQGTRQNQSHFVGRMLEKITFFFIELCSNYKTNIEPPS